MESKTYVYVYNYKEGKVDVHANIYSLRQQCNYIHNLIMTEISLFHQVCYNPINFYSGVPRSCEGACPCEPEDPPTNVRTSADEIANTVQLQNIHGGSVAQFRHRFLTTAWRVRVATSTVSVKIWVTLYVLQKEMNSEAHVMPAVGMFPYLFCFFNFQT